jgi:hypothetical protein
LVYVALIAAVVILAAWAVTLARAAGELW